MSRPVEPDLVPTNPRERIGMGHVISALTFLFLASTLIALSYDFAFCETAFTQQPSETRAASVPSAIQSRVLEPGKPIERELMAAEAHSYQLGLTAGQYVEVLADQRGIDVTLSAFDPNNKKLIETNMFRVGEAELLALVAETSGNYRLEVRSVDTTVARGRYELKIKDLRTATEQDKSSVAAERMVAEGIELDKQATAETWRKAIEKYQQSIPFWQSAKDPSWECTTLYLIANAYIALGEKQKALDFSNQAVAVAEVAVQRSDEEQKRAGMNVKAYALETLGRVHNEFGDKKKALELFSQSLSLRKVIGGRAAEANVINNMATAYKFLGDYQNALSSWSQARVIFIELGDRAKEATALNNICVANEDLGRYTAALDFCNQALDIRRKTNFQLGEATVLGNIGHVHSSLGEYQQALDFYTRAHAIYKTVGNLQGQGVALNNIGFMYGILGEYQKAMDFYNQSLDIFHAHDDQYREANVLNNIANTYSYMKDFSKALEINQRVIVLRKAVHDRDGEAVTLNNLGNCYKNLGEKQKALDYYNQSISLHRSIGNPRQLATALRDAGVLYRDLGQQEKARDYLTEGLQITRSIGDRSGEAETLSYIAGLERDRGNLAEARNLIEQALTAVESLRVNIKSPQLRASFFASVRRYHEFNIDLLMRLHKQHPNEGFDAAAVQATEMGRARSLLELLTEAGAEIRQGVDTSLVQRERSLRQTISDTAERQIRLLSTQHSEEQAIAAAKELDVLTTNYEQVQAEIRQTSPRYAALTQPVPLNLREIQSQLLDDNTLLLEYALGDDRSFVWAITSTSISSFELPRQSEVKAAALRVYDLVTASDHTPPNESPEQRRKRLDQADATFPAAAASLSRMLLDPVAADLKKRRLLIVGEGVLQYVPFAALPDLWQRLPTSSDRLSSSKTTTARKEHPDVRQQNREAIEPLILHHEIVSLPSASVLGVLRREAADRKSPSKTVAVFADPVFDVEDSRVAKADKSRLPSRDELSQIGDLKRSAEETGLNGFPRLRFSRQEAQEIVRLASQNKSLEALDFGANRAAATSPELQQYRIVHFATHGLVNNQHAELSGIVLSLVNKRGDPENGFLRLYDIYNMSLKADLVVLSACQTGLGKDIKGEGLVGLTRAFMYAGATRVVASLWQTEDRATAILMGHFYEGMLANGLSPAAALRNAQVAMWKDVRWRQPRYWAAFTLQGEWK